MNVILSNVVGLCSTITVIFTAFITFVKPFREKILGTKNIKDGQKCLLRAEMLRVYFANKESKKVRQYAYENFILCYKAYKRMGGNSFIDHIKEEVEEWEVIS